MKIPVAVYPYCAELLPIVKHFEAFQNKYKIVKLIAPPGLGLNGKDASYVCNHPKIDMNVTDSFNENDPLWEVLFLPRVCQPGVVDNEQLAYIAELTVSAGKNVIYYDDNVYDVPERISHLTNIYPEKLLIVTEDAVTRINKKQSEYYDVLDTPVILIGGLTSHEDTFEVIVNLAISFMKRGIEATIITKQNAPLMLSKRFHNVSSIFKSMNVSESEKILSLYLYIKEINLIEAPDTLFRFNDFAPNGFGIKTFMISQAVAPDYLICCIPCDLAHEKLLSTISDDMSVLLGSSINAVHVFHVLHVRVHVRQSPEKVRFRWTLATDLLLIQIIAGHQ